VVDSHFTEQVDSLPDIVDSLPDIVDSLPGFVVQARAWRLFRPPLTPPNSGGEENTLRAE